MNIVFYNYSGMNNVVQKTLSPVATIPDANPFKPLSALTGELILNYNADIFAANYCTFLGKSYFVTADRELLPGQRMRLICRIDVLQTYCNSEAFNSIPIVPQRSASKNAYNAWIADTQQPVEVAKYCEIMNPTGYDPALPDACLDYAELSLVAGIIGTEDKIGTTVQQVQTN